MARVLGDDHYKFMTRITVGVTLKNSQEGRKNPKQTNKQKSLIAFMKNILKNFECSFKIVPFA